MRIIHATQPLTREHPVFLIVGTPGIGKTSTGFGDDALLLDFDNGAHRAVNRRDLVVIQEWAELELTRRALDGYGRVTIDTVERCLGKLTTAILEESPKYGANGTLYANGWGVLKQRFGAVLDTLATLGKDVLLLAHAKEVRDGDLRMMRADIPGGSYGEVLKRADFVGYLSMRGGRRVLDFNPSDKFIGKNPGAWPAMDLPPAAQAGVFMAELFARGREALASIARESARIAAALDAWQGDVGAFATPDDFTAGYRQLRGLKAADPAVYAQAHHVLSVAAKTAGMRYDVDLGTFAAVGRPTLSTPPAAASSARRAATVQPALYSALTTPDGAR